MITRRLLKRTCFLLLAFGIAGTTGLAVGTDISTEPLNTYSAPTSTDVKPNVFFVLDDSGSMAWDYMPDWANGPFTVSIGNNSASSASVTSVKVNGWEILYASTSSSSNETTIASAIASNINRCTYSLAGNCQVTGYTAASDGLDIAIYAPTGAVIKPVITYSGTLALTVNKLTPGFLFRNNAYNGVAYNPAIRYTPPVAYNADGSVNTTTYPSQTAAATSNWTTVKKDGYGVQSTSTTNLINNAYYYTTIAGEYCSSPSLKSCVLASAPSADYPYPAKLRWCDSTALTNCRATQDSTYANWRAPSPRAATITISGTSSSHVGGIRVGSQEIMAGSTAATTSATTLASSIAAQINLCARNLNGSCQVAGFSASSTDSSGNPTNVVTIYAPDANTNTPAMTSTGGMTYATTTFAQGTVKGETLRTTITVDVDSYTYPGSTEKATGRSDCAGTTCTYVEEMTNYANWWAYYRTRMQMMKTAASTAFSTIDKPADITGNVSRFRVGFMSLNNNTESDYLNLDEFKTTQKNAWYSKLFRAIPSNSTPLRQALADAGRLYAGKLNGTNFNGSTVVDPLQYSCQQNYTILSTDGFWNGNSGYKMDGTSSVGNQDSALVRPYFDGGSAQLQTRTSNLQTRAVSTQTQSSTSSLQKRTGALQKSTKSQGNWSSWSNATSCDPSNSTQCRYNWGNWSNAASCNESYSAGNGNWTISSGTDCRYTAWTSYSTTASCSAVAQSSGPNYSVATATQCNTQTNYGTWTNASSCTASSTQNCQYTTWTSWSNATSCTAASPSSGPNYTVGTARECRTQTSGGTSNTLADVAAYYYNADLRSADATQGTGTCTGPIIPPATVANNLCVDNVPSSGRDVASTQHMTTFTLGLGAQGQMVYAPTDGKDYWNDTSGDFYDVKNGTTANPATGVCSWQTSGVCNWPTPASDSSANIDDLWHAAINGHGTYFSATDPATLASSLTNTLSTIINTPRPGTAAAAASSNPNVSATDNYVFSSSYKSVDWYGELIRQRITDQGTLTSQNWSAMKLLDCSTTPWTASTSYVAGAVYRRGTSCYTVTNDYTSGASFDASPTGVDLSNAAVINVDETASPKVPVTAKTSRTIYTKGASGLIPFAWSDLVSAGLDSYFTKPILTYTSATSGLSQFCATGGTCLSATAQNNTTIATGGAAGEALVNFLRGDRTYEGSFYRTRTHVLGDIVSAEARYVQAPMFNYLDENYTAYKTAMANRRGAVYVGANDGMLHAFDGVTGDELWAYVPSIVLPHMYKLADKNYATQHQFYVDGTPEVSDICPNAPASSCTSAQWKTILVGGLNRGGKGYYALDITDPAAPSLLWEFTDASLGYAYGNPRITKLKNGTWVVLLSSGYNNADGVGRLYVLNATTGALIRTMSTGAGTASTPSGLARISGRAISPMTDNTVVAAYGGDTLGNLWRFDVNNDIGASGYDAHLLVNFKDAAGVSQPITVKPLEATVEGKPVVYVGTGRYLGTSDVSDTGVQSFYALKDNLDATTYGNPRTASTHFVQQTLASGTCPANASTTVCSPGQIVRTGSSNAVDWGTKNGWYIDYMTGGERSVTDPALGLGMLMFTTIAPQSSSASACGDADINTSASFLYTLDYLTGAPLSNSSGVAAVSLGSGLVTRPVLIKQANGKVRALIRASGGAAGQGTDMGTTIIKDADPPPKPGATRRVSWRELTTSESDPH